MPHTTDHERIAAVESCQLPRRKESIRRIAFARSFWESVIEESLGDENVFGKTRIEIHWKAGEVLQVEVNPGRTYK